jgi:HAE1 family hydrophobic/amphiphilic exporter-1
VARVGYRAREIDMGYAIDGQSGTFLIIRKESEANAVATCEGVRQELERMKADPLFAGVQTFMFFDQAKIIVAALDGVLSAAELGASLAIIVLFAFLLRIRPTLIVALAIPASIVVALIFMFFAGMSLNLVTMIGMMVVLGMLVDNSIVVIENITRHQELGFDPKESALLGASEVAMAITASTLTTLVVGVPLLYLDAGQMATYMRQFMIPIGVALTASLVIALTAIPLAASRMTPRAQLRIVRMFHRPMAAQGPAAGGGLPAFLLRLPIPRMHPIKTLMNSYVRVLDWVLRWRMATVCIVGAVIGISFAIPFRNLERQAEPTMDPRRVEIRLVLEQGFDFPKAKATMESLQNAIEPFREELGIKSIFVRYDRNGGSCDIHLLTEDDLPEDGSFPYTTDEVMDILWQRLARKIPGGELRFSIADASETSSRQFSLQIRGEDARVLHAYADRMKTVMRARIPEVMEVTTDTGREEREIQVHVNEALSSTYGLSPMAIAQTVDFALRGVRLSYLKQGGREIPVWAQFQEEDRKSKSNLENVTVFSTQGAPVPINRVVDFAKEASPQSINRVNGKNVITLTAKTKGENLGRVMRELKALLSDFELPTGYTFEFGDELASLNENMANFGTALLLAVVLIYIVMGALFESYLLPWSIMTTLPVAGVGVVWSLYLSGTALDIVAMIGIILLAGIIVNNGIVLIDFINQLRQRGRSRRDAILEAGRARMRPIMMTALTTILGCVPLVLGRSLGADVSFASLGWSLIGGLTVGTVLTLFVVPLAYTVFDDLRNWFGSFFGTLGRLSALARR